MGFYLSFAHFSACVFLFVMHAVLVGLLGISFHGKTGNPFEVGCIVIDLIAMILLAAQFVHYVRREWSGLSTKIYVLYAGILLLLTTVGSLILTARASQTPSLWADYVGLSFPEFLAAMTLVTSWCTTLIAVVGLVLAFLDKKPDDSDVWEPQFTTLPDGRRLRFRRVTAPVSPPPVYYPQEKLERVTRPIVRQGAVQPGTTHPYWIERRLQPKRTANNRRSREVA
ncbi:hypothetical protein BKA93DRAFT_419567 [Sparassis latifolia]|uniref:MARVEL domain-containing protein n=1 Tax=Sparassis crispa TaxID=139825 RepID=A0A401GJY4_9APHY|nr:hypothetical protein SCP_0408590 [Sparassis crispa]GBE82475.1 hypothetical protein SCP_0408590 [Sparassis crispa]